MKSNIIRLGDYQMDDQDRYLRDLFSHPPLADSGFSDRVMKRIRRRALLRRSLLPTALVVGLLFAAQPATTLVSALLSVLAAASGGLLQDGAGSLLNVTVGASALPGGIYTCIGLLAAAFLMFRLIEE